MKCPKLHFLKQGTKILLAVEVWKAFKCPELLLVKDILIKEKMHDSSEFICYVSPFLFFLISDYCRLLQRGFHRRVPQKLKYKFYIILITIVLESAIKEDI